MFAKFDEMPAVKEKGGLYGETIDILQINAGLVCNQTCAHCHLAASPARTESMGRGVMEKTLEIADNTRPALVDITGGAPELFPHLKEMVQRLRASGHDVQVRTNLTAIINTEPEDWVGFYREHRVRLVGSMPCYLEKNVDAQRGSGVYKKSIAAIKKLNEAGYGGDPELQLNLVYNPGGPALPPSQADLEKAYKAELDKRFGIHFTSLLTITNMPIGRFWNLLERENRLKDYSAMLRFSFNPNTIDGLMCRHQVCIAWDGKLYDCDFNIALNLPIIIGGKPATVWEFDADKLQVRRIITGEHCFGCTAGCGSSCRGALA